MHICDLIPIFSRQGTLHIKLHYIVHSSLYKSVTYTFTVYHLHFLSWINDSMDITIVIPSFLNQHWLGEHFHCGYNVPYIHSIYMVDCPLYSKGKILWRDACKLLIFYFLTFFFSVFMFVEWICLFSLIFISLEILRKSSRNKFIADVCVYMCVCVCVCIYHILKISVSEIQNGGWDFNVWKKREKLKLEKPFCLSYCIEETTFIIMLLTNMMNILMLFQMVWEVFDEKGINYI